MTKLTKLEEIVLGTFSFYEPMTFSKLILDLNSDELKDFPNFTREDLEAVINGLVKKRLLKSQQIDKELGWIRLHPQKSWWKRLFSL
jgi:hypothetical protein